MDTLYKPLYTPSSISNSTMKLKINVKRMLNNTVPYLVVPKIMRDNLEALNAEEWTVEYHEESGGLLYLPKIKK